MALVGTRVGLTAGPGARGEDGAHNKRYAHAARRAAALAGDDRGARAGLHCSERPLRSRRRAAGSGERRRRRGSLAGVSATTAALRSEVARKNESFWPVPKAVYYVRTHTTAACLHIFRTCGLLLLPIHFSCLGANPLAGTHGAVNGIHNFSPVTSSWTIMPLTAIIASLPLFSSLVCSSLNSSGLSGLSLNGSKPRSPLS